MMRSVMIEAGQRNAPVVLVEQTPPTIQLWFSAQTPDPRIAEPESAEQVMGDVDMVLMNPDLSWSGIARFLIPLAFRLLCMAAFR